MVSGLQIRAARGFLCWDRRDLARKSVVPLSTGALNAGLSAIKKALEAEGIEFIDGDIPGVLLHPKKGKTTRRTSPR
jgi:hypothetical protein